MSRTRSTFGDVMAAFGRHVLAVLSGIISVSVVGHLLGAEALGAWTTLGTASFIVGLADLGLSTATQRADVRGGEGEAERALGAAFRAIAVTGPLFTLIAILALRAMLKGGAPTLAPWDLQATTVLALLGGLVGIPSYPVRALMFVRGCVREVAIARGLGALAQILVGSLGVYLTHRLVFAGLGLFASQAVELALLVGLGRAEVPEFRRWPAPPRDRAEVRVLARDAVATLVVNGSMILSSRFDVMILLAYVPLRDLAAYGVAMRGVDQSVVLAKQSSAAMLGRLSRVETRQSGMQIGTATLGVLASSGLVALAVLGQPLLRLWAGEAVDHPMVPLALALLALANIITCLGEIPSSTLMVGGKSPWLSAGPIAVGSVVNVTLTLSLVPTMGGIGAAYGTLYGEAVAAGLLWWFGRQIGWRIGYLLPAVVSALCAFGCAYVLRPYVHGAGSSALLCGVTTLVGLALGWLTWRYATPAPTAEATGA